MAEMKKIKNGKKDEPGAVNGFKAKSPVPDAAAKVEIETKNTAKPGDWIVMASTGAAEEAPVWVVLGKKFPKLYETSPGTAHPSKEGFACYKVKPEQRIGIVVTNETLLLARQEFGENTPSQKDFFDFVASRTGSGEMSAVPVRKVDTIYARQVKPEEGEIEVVTKVKAGNEPRFNFTADWGEVMPVAVDDVLIYMPHKDDFKGEVYRIARAEFDRTYVLD